MSGWIQFQAECGRERLFSERLLADPIGQFLLAHHPDKLEVEYKHPAFSSRSIDFAVLSSEDSNSPPSEVMETKFVTPKRGFTQEICDDLMRLEAAVNHVPDCRGLFLVVGLGKHLKAQVVTEFNESENTPPLQKVLAGDQKTYHEVEIENSENGLRKNWESSLSRISESIGPTQIGVSLASQWPHEAVIQDDAWTCIVWEIKCVANRQTWRVPDGSTQ